MTHNPYAAPRAAVSDTPPPPMERPRAVVVAVMLFWTELALGLLDSALDWNYLTADDSVMFVLIVEALFVGLSALINIKIWQGRSWARILALVLTTIGVASYALLVGEELARAPVVTVLAIIELTLDVVGLYLVFIPGRAWFARR